MSSQSMIMKGFASLVLTLGMGLTLVPFEVSGKEPRTSTTSIFVDCPQFFYQGIPPNLPKAEHWKARALCFDAFAVLHSGKTRTPIYVAERLNKQHLEDARNEVRTNEFFADARLPFSERAELNDYQGSGYDRGHMAPAGDMPTTQAMAQSFSLANVIPQAPQNNRGPWAKSVEMAVRKYVMRAKGDVYVITGPVFTTNESASQKINRVWVPEYLFKLVYDPSANKAWAYWLPNQDGVRIQGVISYQDLVNRTGIEFLPALSSTPVEVAGRNKEQGQ